MAAHILGDVYPFYYVCMGKDDMFSVHVCSVEFGMPTMNLQFLLISQYLFIGDFCLQAIEPQLKLAEAKKEAGAGGDGRILGDNWLL